MFRHLILAIQFYTRIPLPSLKDTELKDYAYSLAWGPVAGAVIALILKWLLTGLQWMNMNLFTSASLLLLVYVVLTGGIHFDGIADTFDGAGSGQKGDKLLKILKDPTIGSLGGIFLILSFLTYFYFFYRISAYSPPFYVWAWPFVMSRSLPVFLSASLPYLSGEQEGYRNSFVDLISWPQVVFTLFLVLLFQSFWMPADVHLYLIPLLIAVFLISWGFVRWKFKAVNGDMLGASIIFLEMVYFHWMIQTQLL